MMRRFLVALAVLCGFLGIAATPVQALSVPPQAAQFAVCNGGLANYLGFEPWYSCLQRKNGSVSLREFNDIWLVVLPILEDLFRAAGYIATGFIAWGGFKFIKSQGNPSELSAAQDIIRNALIGLAWTVLSVAIVEFVGNGIIGGTI